MSTKHAHCARPNCSKLCIVQVANLGKGIRYKILPLVCRLPYVTRMSYLILGYLFCFILISWGCLTSWTLFIYFCFCFSQWATLIGPLQKKVKTMETPQNRRFYGKMECLPLWPTYIGEKGRTLGKTHGIKVRCYWKHPWRKHWEPDGNPLGTWREHVWEQRNFFKKSFCPPPQTWKKKIKALWVHAEPSHWLHEISMFQNCSSPFLAWANTPIINWGYLFDFISRLSYMYTHK